jgi:hypothetical protein
MLVVGIVFAGFTPVAAASVSGQTSGTNTQLVGGVLAGTGPAVALYAPNDQAYGFAVNTSCGL